MLITAFTTGVRMTDEACRVGSRTIAVVTVTAMTTELAPVLTGRNVVGRAEAEMAAKPCTIRVPKQIDALEAIAIQPVKYLIGPRFITVVIMIKACCFGA